MAHVQFWTGSALRSRPRDRLRTIGVIGLAITMAASLLIMHAETVAAQPCEGCPSKEIAARFEEFSQSGKMPPDLGRWLHDPKAQQIEPWKAFDNVYFVGVCWVSAWAIRTTDGAVLIDTLHEPHVDQLVANLRKVGIDLAEIKYVLITHGHFDHAGGAVKLKLLLPNAKFVMTQTGWDEARSSATESQGTPIAWSMIPQEVVVKNGGSIRLGDNTFGILETPGHTMGTASFTYEVRDGSTSYRAITIGGLGLNAIKDSRQVESYISSVDRISELIKQVDRPVTVHLTTHPFSTGLMEMRERFASRKPGEPNPLVNPQALIAQVAGLRSGAERRLEIERKAGR
jgi:metallo-beta-lactamase class B